MTTWTYPSKNSLVSNDGFVLLIGSGFELEIGSSFNLKIGGNAGGDGWDEDTKHSASWTNQTKN